MMALLTIVFLLCLEVLPSYAQFAAPAHDLTTLQSYLDPAVEIAYKETHICETTPGVKSYSGYAHLPASALKGVADYNISTFFWYFEARHNPRTAPLAIYLSGGPGEPSSKAVISSESGPCYVNPDGNSTTVNPWSFNQHVNMLYIDQPVQTGFSYNSLIPGTFNLETSDVTPLESYGILPNQNATFRVGTFSSQNPLQITNTSITSAKALWRFAEHWFTSFPEYNTKSKQVSIWGNSYGGYWVPAVTAYFDQQIKAASSHPKLHALKMSTMGLTNGCVDFLTQTPYYPQYAYNNTYAPLIPEAIYRELNNNFTKTDGCKDLIEECRQLGQLSDPDFTGANQTVNEACTLATNFCYAYAIGTLNAVNRDDFDIAITSATIDSCGPGGEYLPMYTFLNQPWVLADLGVPLNWTWGSNVILDVYSLKFGGSATIGTGDSFRRGKLDFEYVLQNDIGVSMIFGDRDYRCNWLAGEGLSLEAQYPGKKQFNAAGYEKIVTNNAYDGGVVRQHGKFSFARIFESGHSVSAYQPETVYRIFQRSMFGQDVATGMDVVGFLYSSKGPSSSFGIKNKLRESPSGCIVEGRFVKGTG